MPRTSTLLVFVLLGISRSLPAEVVDSAANGFTVRSDVAIKAPVETVWRVLAENVDDWWHSDHTYTGNAANLYIDARPLGCFCERLDAGGAVVHMTVTFANPGKMLRLSGGLGPLGLMGVDGNLVFSLRPGNEVSYVTVTYAVGGYAPDGLDAIAGAVDGVISDQAARLRRLIETGNADAG